LRLESGGVEEKKKGGGNESRRGEETLKIRRDLIADGDERDKKRGRRRTGDFAVDC